MPDEQTINARTKRPRGGRMEANLYSIETDTLNRTPWIDFLAAGVTGASGHRFGWVAFVHTAPEFLSIALSIQSRPTSNAWRIVQSERARTVNRILFQIEEDVQADRPRILCELPRNISALCAEYFEKAFANRKDGTSGIASPESLIITWGNEPHVLPESFDGMKTCHFAQFDEMLEFVFAPLRIHYGAGWLSNSATFLQHFISDGRPTNRTGGMVKASPAHEGHSPAEIAALATARLVSFGWLPMNMNCRAAMLGDAIKDPLSKKARHLRKLSDQGLRVFEMPRIAVKNMKSLNVSHASLLADAIGMHFTSRNRHDRALLAIEFTGYWNRDRKRGAAAGIDQRDADQHSHAEAAGKYFLLRLPLNAISVIQTLFPWARATVISYSEAASATGRAGILSRMIRHYSIHGDSGRIKDQIVQQVRHLTYPSLLIHTIELPGYSRGRDTTNLDLCQYMKILDDESVDDEATSSCGQNGKSPSAGVMPISLICSMAESSATKDAPPISEVCRLMPSFLPISPASAAAFSDSSTIANPKKSERELARIDRDVRDHSSEAEEVQLSRAAHFRPLTLFRNLLRLFHGIKNLRLSVPDFLHQWICSMFRLVWVVPLEPMGSMHTCMVSTGSRKSISADKGAGDPDPDSTFFRSTYTGSPLSPQFYPLLFSPNRCESGCEVNIEPLLMCALQSVEMIGADTGLSWLMRRINESNQLMEDLKGRIGYSPDFEPSLNHGFTDLSLRLLVSQASDTILRCILIQDGGRQILEGWSLELMRRVRQFLHDGIPDRYGPAAGHEGDMNRAEVYQELSRLFEQLRIFEDASGIAAAALDCIRNSIMEDIARGRGVADACRPIYFRMDKLTRYFRPRIKNSSPGTKDRFDDADQEEGSLEDEVMRDFDVLLIKCFTEVPFSANRAAALVKIWHNNEGLQRGETPDGLFEELAEEMYDGRPPADFIEKRNATLAALARF